MSAILTPEQVAAAMALAQRVLSAGPGSDQPWPTEEEATLARALLAAQARLDEADALLDRLETVCDWLEFQGHDKRCPAWTRRGDDHPCTCGRDATLADLCSRRRPAGPQATAGGEAGR